VELTGARTPLFLPTGDPGVWFSDLLGFNIFYHLLKYIGFINRFSISVTFMTSM